jgi:hypothetical protein
VQFNELLRLLGEIDEFKGYWRKLRELRAERLGQLRQITTIESAGSSTRIEGRSCPMPRWRWYSAAFPSTASEPAMSRKCVATANWSS